jgi:hypothetical protein
MFGVFDSSQAPRRAQFIANNHGDRFGAGPRPAGGLLAQLEPAIWSSSSAAGPLSGCFSSFPRAPLSLVHASHFEPGAFHGTDRLSHEVRGNRPFCPTPA